MAGNAKSLDLGVRDQSHHNVSTIKGSATVNHHYGPVYHHHGSDSDRTCDIQPKPPAIPRCPPPSLYYTHRETTEKHIDSYFDGNGRKCYVLSGPVGAGKTEIALAMADNLCYSQEPGAERFSEVYWVNARSVETIEESFKAIALSTGTGSEAKDALRLLASRRGPEGNWMVLFDGADNPHLDLMQYFPKCSHGNILITTRNYHCVRRYCVGKESDHVVFAMTPDEALMLFKRHAHLSNRASLKIIEAAKTLVKELGYFALSISQVASCISASQRNPAQYLGLNHDQRQNLLLRYEQKKPSDNYPYGSAHAAWKVTYNGLSNAARELLRVFVCMHHEGIKEEFVSNVCFGGLDEMEAKYGPLLTEREQAGLARLKQLRNSLSTDGDWDADKFRQLVSELQSHSLIRFDPEQATCSIHPLVQEWVTNLGDVLEQSILRQCAILLLGSSIGRFDAPEDRVLYEALVLHIDRVFQETTGKWDDTVVHRELYKELCIRRLGKGHRDTAASATNISSTSQSQRQYGGAKAPQLQMMRVPELIVGADDPCAPTPINNPPPTHQTESETCRPAEPHQRAKEAQKKVLRAEDLYMPSQIIEVNSRKAFDLALPVALGEDSDQRAHVRRILAGYASQAKLSWDDFDNPNGGTLNPTEIGNLCDTGDFALVYTNYSIHSVTLTPDGKHIVSGSENNTVQIWDAATGRCVKQLSGHTHWAWFVAVSPDGKLIASGSWDNTIRIWDLETGISVGEPWKGCNDRIRSVAFSPDGKHIVSGSDDKLVQIWDVAAGQCIKWLSRHTYTFSVAVSPDGKFIASGVDDSTIRIWDFETGASVGESWKGHTGYVRSIAFSPDGKHIVSGSDDKTIQIWDVPTGRCLAQLLGHTHWVWTVAVSPDGKLVASGSWDMTIRLWDLETGASVGKPLTGHTNPVNSIAFSPNGEYIISGSADSTIRRWRLSALGIGTSTSS